MVVDSSIWLEIFLDGPLASKCQKHMGKHQLQIPTSVVYEVYRKLKQKLSDDVALDGIAVFSNYKLIEFDREIALLAADISLEYDLGFADSIVLASAKHCNQKLLTLDNDFLKIPDAIIVR